MRGEWAGIAVNLRTDTPTPEAVREGVDKVLGEESFRVRAWEISSENEGLDALARLEGVINEAT